MKVAKLVYVLSLFFTLVLGGCGGGSIKSPDFDADLNSIVISSVNGKTSVARGDTLRLAAVGQFTAPPGQSPGAPSDISNSVDWKSSDEAKATVDDHGVLTPVGVGDVTITASRGDVVSLPLVITIGAAEVRGLIIRAETGATDVTLAKGQSARLLAYGVYSDRHEELIDSSEFRVNWTSLFEDYAIVTPATGTTTMVDALSQGATTITAKLSTLLGASVLGADGVQIADTSIVTVTSAQAARLEYIQFAGTPMPSASPVIAPTDTLRIAAGVSSQAVVVATFTDGTIGTVAQEQLSWSTVPASRSSATVTDSGFVTGVAPGTVTLKAALKTPIPGGVSTITRELVVTSASCTNPARSDHFTATGYSTPLLCLLCSVANPESVIDADDTNFATLKNTVALLTGATSINIGLKSGEPSLNTGPMPTPVKFLVEIDPGTFPVLTLDLANRLSVSLHADGNGETAAHLLASSGRNGANPVELSLLGLRLVPGLDTIEVSFTPPPNIEYRRVRLTNSSIVQANLSGTVKVSNACISD